MIPACLVPDDVGSEQRLYHYNYPTVATVLWPSNPSLGKYYLKS